MSHHKITFSPEGTPLADRTVGELVAERPGRSRIFQEFQIDFCCQGGRALRDACKRNGVVLEDIVAKLEAEEAGGPAPKDNPAELLLHELAEYIVKNHHDYIRAEIPRIHAMSARVAQVHGGHTPALIEVFHIFDRMCGELNSHMEDEEKFVFPAVSALSREGASPIPLDGPIAKMISEHNDTGSELERMRELTGGFQPPEQACNTWRALLSGLADFEENMHRHIHLENSVLFPAAEKLAKKAA